MQFACTSQIAKPVHCWSFILSELVAGVPRGAQNFGYVCTGPSFYNFYSEKAIKLFVRLHAALYFPSLSYKTFKIEKTATDFHPQAYLAGLKCLYWFEFWLVNAKSLLKSVFNRQSQLQLHTLTSILYPPSVIRPKLTHRLAYFCAVLCPQCRVVQVQIIHTHVYFQCKCIHWNPGAKSHDMQLEVKERKPYTFVDTAFNL